MGRVWLAAAAASVLLSSGPTYPPYGAAIGEWYGDPSVVLPWLAPCGPASAGVTISLEATMGYVYPERSGSIADVPLHYAYVLRVRPVLDGPGAPFDCGEVTDIRYFVISSPFGYGEDAPLEIEPDYTGSLFTRIYNRGEIVQEARVFRSTEGGWAEVVVYVPQFDAPDVMMHHQAVVLVYVARALRCIMTSNGVVVRWIPWPAAPK